MLFKFSDSIINSRCVSYLNTQFNILFPKPYLISLVTADKVYLESYKTCHDRDLRFKQLESILFVK
jgi:hypothetical protein